MKTRPTVLKAMVDKANRWLANSADNQTDARQMLHDFVCSVLMESGSYQGFNYQYWRSIGCNEWIDAGEPSDKDTYIYGPSGDQTRTYIY